MGYDTFLSGILTIAPPLENTDGFNDGDYEPWFVYEDRIESPAESTRSGYYEAALVALVHDLAAMERVVNGEASWGGEERDDFGKWTVTNNVITRQEGFCAYGYTEVIGEGAYHAGK